MNTEIMTVQLPTGPLCIRVHYIHNNYKVWGKFYTTFKKNNKVVFYFVVLTSVIHSH